MLSRPKPGESEVDLLRFQSQFLEAGAAPAVQLVKGSRRHGDVHPDQLPPQDRRDVVMLDNLPDVPPALVPAPAKRARPSPGHALPHDEDPEERLSRHDQHITAVLSKIIERDTSSVTVTLPVSSGVPFPAVFHRSKERQGKLGASGKRSIFAQEIAARRAAENRVSAAGEDPPEGAVPSETPSSRDEGSQFPRGSHDFHRSNLVTGKGLRSQAAEQEVQTIHEENVARLQAMAPEEILKEQQQLLAQLDPSLVAFLRSHSHALEQAGTKDPKEQSPERPTVPIAKEEPIMSASTSEPMEEDKLEPRAPALKLPVTPHKEWLHMDTVELEKLHWTQDLPPLRRQQTQERMQARFSLQGELLAPDVDLPTHLGLHHHGEEAERAGYSLQELFHLTRSQVSQQRALALQVLSQIIGRAQAGEFGDCLVGSILRLLLDAGFLFLLRFSLDDRVDGVIAAAVRALRTLLVAPGDEELLDSTFSWYHGASVFPLMPSQEDKDDEGEDEEPTTKKVKKKAPEEESRPPPDLARHDVIKGLLATNLLPRLRYVLEVTCPGPSVVLDILAVLIRLARHSLESATRVLECPRLIETIVQEFLPTSWSPMGVGPTSSLHKVPCAAAMKLLRVLASAGKNIAARLFSSFDFRSRLSRFIAEAPQELALPAEEAEMLSTEAFRLWAVVASYGQGGDLYRELYPVLMRTLQTLPTELSTHPPKPLSMQRIASLLTLLTQLTLAASSTHPEPSSDSAEACVSAIPSSVTWAQVSGLQPLIEPCLKQTLKFLPRPDVWNALGPVPSACLLFLGAYYQSWSQQATLQPQPATSTALHHTIALALLSRLLPGSEYLAQELLLSCVFRLEFLPENASGGPEAADFSDGLSLRNSGDPQCKRGALLVQACQDLPSIRSCYLAHCSPARASLLTSQALYRGELLRVSSLLLPVPKEPLLPTDWPFQPLIHLYHRASDAPSGLPAADTVGIAMRVLQWVLVLESWRPEALCAVPPGARLARLMCVFLVDSELFRETPVQHLVVALLVWLCRPQVLPNLNLDCPLPGLTSFPDLYASFLDHFEAVSFGDHLFGALVLLPLQRRFSVTLRLSLFGEHVGVLRALGLPLTQLPVPLECFTEPAEDSLPLLQLYFRALVTGALRPHWCPVLYAVSVAHVNSFIFSQDPKSSDEVKASRRNMLQKTWLLADEGLRQHLLHYKLPNSSLPEGFELYSQLPRLRQQYLQTLPTEVLQNGGLKT
uniref:RNA polymerase II-associated protein 1 isoform X3 n=1 Tax=Myodes glareolus TaxID=447135 RepID=UPI00202067C8|nr:RNA polymerase II-associated protein 1 isoform X3 [Myodes glareolus]